MTKTSDHPQVKPLLSDSIFSVDGNRLIEAGLHQKAFRPKMAAVTMMTGATSRPEAPRTTPMPKYHDPDRRLTAKPPGREASCYMATPPWRIRHGLAVPAWSRTPLARPTPSLGDHAEAKSKAAGRRITAR